MSQPTDVSNVCCVAIELSKSSWIIAFSPPADGGKSSLRQIAAKDINRLLGFLEGARSKAEREASRPLQIVVPASFLMPRKGRRAKTDRLSPLAPDIEPPFAT